MEPFPLANGHGRCILYITGKWLLRIIYNRYKFVTALIRKGLCKARSASEAATWIQEWFQTPAGAFGKL